MPEEHSPTSVSHGRVVPPVHTHPSSTVPSQSSSRIPSHTSVPAVTPPMHEPTTPALHVSVPGRHTPVLLPHARVTPSSIGPSQSSSALLQDSSVGPIAPVHDPHSASAQLCVPAVHAPTSLPHARVSSS